MAPASPPAPFTGPFSPSAPNRPLAGQPVARPVVPPRPDILARLQQQNQPKAAPGAPTYRPAMPQQPRPSAPVPGQPIYRGPFRPGQSMPMRPGGPGQGMGMGMGMGPGGPGQPLGPGGRPMLRRPLHPTSPLRPETAVAAPTEAGRRHATKPTTRKQQQKEEQEGRLQFRAKREEAIVATNSEITISEGITVKGMSEKLGVKTALVIRKLVDMKIFATINQPLDLKVAEDLALAFKSTATRMSYEEEATFNEEIVESTADLQTRPPVVTIMGHVDHGKTSLLDAIRTASVASREAGGITQHIGAYQVERNGQKITFIDTPGHEAFTRMRARGAKVTDIVVLVVAADDGVMPQTLEAIDHARAAKVPLIVAINKIDKPDATPDRIKQQLNDRGLLATDWGGDVEMIPVSAKTHVGIDTLLETILLVAEIGNFKANPNRSALATVLEAQLDRGRGPVATVLVRNGTLRVGDYFICGSVFGKVRALNGDRGEQIKEAEPSKPVEVLGLEELPDVGDAFQVVTDTTKAKQIVMFRESKARDIDMARRKRLSLEQFHRQMKEGDGKELNLIIKADVGGSAEVLGDTLSKLSNEQVAIRVILTGVGAITETDVLLATASNGIIIGFNVRPEKTAKTLADKEKIDIRLHSIIYEVVDEIKKAMTGMLEPIIRETYQGKVEIREVFKITKVGQVAGSFVVDGFVTRNSEVRVLRDNVVVHTGKIESLKRFKNDVAEVKQNFECGISLANYKDVKAGDILEAFITEKVAAVLFS